MSLSAHALDPIYTALFSDKAIRGYDTVAFFLQQKPVKGKSEFSTQYKGATWLFSSQKNLDLFMSSPDKYAPQYGGYCAYVVSQKTTASIQPELFTIYEGKLYLNYRENINSKWLENIISDADSNWPNLVSN